MAAFFSGGLIVCAPLQKERIGRIGRTSCIFEGAAGTVRADKGGYVMSSRERGERMWGRSDGRVFFMPGVDGGRRKTYDGDVFGSEREEPGGRVGAGAHARRTEEGRMCTVYNV